MKSLVMCFTMLIIFAMNLGAQAIDLPGQAEIKLFPWLLLVGILTVASFVTVYYLIRNWIIVSQPKQWIVFFIVGIIITFLARSVNIGYMDDIPVFYVASCGIGIALMAYGLYCMNILTLLSDLYKKISAFIRRKFLKKKQ